MYICQEWAWCYSCPHEYKIIKICNYRFIFHTKGHIIDIIASIWLYNVLSFNHIMIQCIILHSYSIIVVPPYKKRCCEHLTNEMSYEMSYEIEWFHPWKMRPWCPFFATKYHWNQNIILRLKNTASDFPLLPYIPMIFIHYRKGSSTLSCISNSNGSGHHLRHENHRLEAPSRSLLAGSPTVFFLLSKHHEIPMG